MTKDTLEALGGIFLSIFFVLGLPFVFMYQGIKDLFTGSEFDLDEIFGFIIVVIFAPIILVVSISEFLKG